MTQNEIPKPAEYKEKLNYSQKLVFDRLLGDRKIEEAFEEVFLLMQKLTITSGFTLDQLDDLMNGFRSGREAEKQQEVARIEAECKGLPVPVQEPVPQLIGWIFKFPKTGATKLVRQIEVKRMDMLISISKTEFPESDLTYSSGATASLKPKVFYQLNEVDTDDFGLPYPLAFSYTRPGVIDAPELPMDELEGYFPWADLAMLQRGNLANFADYVFSGDSATFNDLFFSGANLDYRTMHNPSMRLEQLNLKDSATSVSVGPDSRTPFTLKAEPYVAAATPRKDWIPRKEAIPIETENGPALVAFLKAATQKSTSDTIAEADSGGGAPPISSHLFPCPSVWEYTNQFSQIAMTNLGDNDMETFKKIQSSVYKRITKQDDSEGSIILESVTLADRPRILPENITPDQPQPPANNSKGCMSILLVIIILLISLNF